jgi:hypothetical protein
MEASGGQKRVPGALARRAEKMCFFNKMALDLFGKKKESFIPPNARRHDDIYIWYIVVRESRTHSPCRNAWSTG